MLASRGRSLGPLALFDFRSASMAPLWLPKQVVQLPERLHRATLQDLLHRREVQWEEQEQMG